MSEVKRVVVLRPLCAAAVAAGLYLWMQPPATAQEEAPASRGENFSAKPAPQLFASDCTGSGCHQSPQGLAKGQSQGSLAGFLREHYTNSRKSAAALASYLMKIPSAPSAARATRPHPSARSSRASTGTDEGAHPVPPARVRRSAESGEASSKPAARTRRGRQVRVPPPPEPPTPPVPPKQFDIFD